MPFGCGRIESGLMYRVLALSLLLSLVMNTAEMKRMNSDSHSILIVKENGADRERVSAALQRSGYRVMVASDGKEGLALFRKHSKELDLVMTDVVMSEMDGVDLISRIREISSTAKVLFFSGQKGWIVKSLSGATTEPIERRVGTGVAPAGISPLLERRSPFTLLLRRVKDVLNDRGNVMNFLKRCFAQKDRFERSELEDGDLRITQLWRSALVSDGILTPGAEQKTAPVPEMKD
jgi:CheY-like chemotaxis protein